MKTQFQLKGHTWGPWGYKDFKEFTLEFATLQELKAAELALRQIHQGLYIETNFQVPLNIPIVAGQPEIATKSRHCL